ncbi:hypothetical protein M0R72_15960 [Candidatus Pacearchaeota archaeon]|nr:hypothetical protein [Candidatus Pacearchaeota archaeon]
MSMKRKRYTGTTAMAIVTDISGEFALYEVRVHLPVVEGTTANMVISLDSGVSDDYNFAFQTTAMAAATDVQYLPTRPLYFAANDQIALTWANANSKAWAIEIIYE